MDEKKLFRCVSFAGSVISRQEEAFLTQKEERYAESKRFVLDCAGWQASS